jgi:hypothetical protein
MHALTRALIIVMQGDFEISGVNLRAFNDWVSKMMGG